MVVLDPTLLGTVAVTEGLKEDGIAVGQHLDEPGRDTQRRPASKRGQVFTVDASHIAIEEIGREITNTPMLGALARATGLFDIEELSGELRAWFGKKLPPRGRRGQRPGHAPGGRRRTGRVRRARMKLKGWRELPIGGMILEAGNAVDYHHRRLAGLPARPRPGRVHPLLPVLAVLPRL